MNIKQRKQAFVRLGNFFRDFVNGVQSNEIDIDIQNKFKEKVETAHLSNGWFTYDNVMNAISSWAEALKEENIDKWLSLYPESKIQNPKCIGIIMAGNIPMVGFHDFLCVLISGNKVFAKTSSEDKILIPTIAEILISIEPNFKTQIEFTENQLKNIDAAIATGSNNSARYFEYYFGKYPHIIRKNRNSVAVLNGSETSEELKLLGKDIFTYFGMGCRNVSKLFVPKNYNFNLFFESIIDFGYIIHNNKYNNNYSYNRTVYLMGSEKLLDNNFLILKEDKNLSSPVAVLFYEFYENENQLKNRLKEEENNIQCIVGKNIPQAIPFGKTQQPQLWDYADGVDTMKFLVEL